MAPLTEKLEAGPDGPSAARSVVETRVGQLVAGAYRITRHIGSGGSGHVFAAEHVRLGKPFAVKLLRTELDCSRGATQRFRREARAVARLASEHIVSVIDCGELADQTPYLVMELLEGEDLRSLLNRDGALPARRAVQIVIEACRGLKVVHAAGLVHRDLKPENLFITRRAGGEDWCKVLDFGVAKMDASLSTVQGAIIGTVRYMAPEQLTDGDLVGPATDVYALGAVLYECLSGTPLADGKAVHEVMYRIMNVPPRPLGEVVPALPPALTAIVDACLSKSPTERPAGVGELARLLSESVAPARFPQAPNDTQAEDNERPTPSLSLARKPKRFILAGLVWSLAAGFAGWALRTTPATAVAAPAPPLPRLLSGASTPPVIAALPGVPAQSSPQALEAPVSPSAAPTSFNGARPRSDHPAPAKPGTAASTTPPAKPAGRFDSTNPYGE